MSKVEKISVSLTHDMADTVKAAVKSGDYGSTSEVVREAIREWTHNRSVRASEIVLLREAWNTGVNSGSGTQNSIDDIIETARLRRNES